MANPKDGARASNASRRQSTPSPAPQSLAQQIRRALAADPRFAGMNPRVDEHNGSVLLRGWVPLLRDKKRMELVAASVAGPSRVQNELLVGPPNQRPPDEIQRDVDDFVMADIALDPRTIHAAVDDGVVHLTGTVDTTMSWRYVGALCWWIPGVRGVRNDLQVRHPEPPDDELLASAVQLLLEKDPLVDVTEILVICKAGVVTLAGTVAGQDARDAAESDAWAIDGVRDVANEIEIAEIPGAPPIVGLGG